MADQKDFKVKKGICLEDQTSNENDVSLRAEDGVLKQLNGSVYQPVVDETENYLKKDNTNFEDSIGDWTGDSNIVLSHLTSGQLRGDGSLRITKSAVDASGQTVKAPTITVDKADLSKKMMISFDYDFSDSDYSDGDVRVQVVQDPAGTPVVIRTNGEDIKAGKGKHYAQFQTDATITEYQLQLVVVTTDATELVLDIDDVVLTQARLVYGQNVKIQQGELTGASLLTNIRRFSSSDENGDTELITYSDDGTNATRLTSNFDDVRISLTYQDESNGTNNNSITFIRLNGGVISEAWGYESGLSLEFDNTTHITLNQGDYLEFVVNNAARFQSTGNAKVNYIATLKTTNRVSEDLGGRDVIVVASGSSGTSVGTSSNIDWTNVQKDTTSSWNGTQFTAPESGSYDVEGMIRADANAGHTIRAFVDGVGDKFFAILPTADDRLKFSGKILLEAGQVLSFRNTIVFTSVSDDNIHWIHIEKEASPQTILETETVAARYTSDNGQTVSDNSNIEFENLEFDTHNAYNTSTGVYTVPVSGLYQINATVLTAPVTGTEGNIFGISVSVNGVSEEDGRKSLKSTASVRNRSSVNPLLMLNKGDEVEVVCRENITNAITLDTSVTFNVFSIARIK